MAKKKAAKSVNKSAEIRAYLESHPGVKPSAAAEELQKNGIDVTAQYISVVKSASKTRKKSTTKTSIPRTTAKHNVDRVSVETLVQVKNLVERIGSLEETRGALEALEKLSK